MLYPITAPSVETTVTTRAYEKAIASCRLLAPSAGSLIETYFEICSWLTRQEAISEIAETIPAITRSCCCRQIMLQYQPA